MTFLAPHEYPRRLLLCVTGLTPQIVTETLFALAHSDPAFLPTEIHVITTGAGATLVKNALLHPNGGQFWALLKDYPQLGRPFFDENHIHVITNADGTPLDDIRTPEENAAAADAITSLMTQLTRDEDSALHVSIAGGRKTMGFFLGYAFSLYARPQDRLSHVLVSPPFESHPEFFFPPAQPRQLVKGENQFLDTADAKITLAEIPVVLLRHGVPQALREGRATYVETVKALNEALAPPRLIIDLPAQRVLCGQREVKLAPALLAWYAFWAQTALSGQAMRHWREIDPQEYLRWYRRLSNPLSEAYERIIKRLKDGLDEQIFTERNAKLERALKRTLGEAAKPYLLAREGKRPWQRRGLRLPPGAIQIIDCPEAKGDAWEAQ